MDDQWAVSLILCYLLVAILVGWLQNRSAENMDKQVESLVIQQLAGEIAQLKIDLAVARAQQAIKEQEEEKDADESVPESDLEG